MSLLKIHIDNLGPLNAIIHPSMAAADNNRQGVRATKRPATEAPGGIEIWDDERIRGVPATSDYESTG